MDMVQYLDGDSELRVRQCMGEGIQGRREGLGTVRLGVGQSSALLLLSLTVLASWAGGMDAFKTLYTPEVAGYLT